MDRSVLGLVYYYRRLKLVWIFGMHCKMSVIRLAALFFRDDRIH